MGDEPGDEEPAERLASFHIIRIGLGSVDNDGSQTREGGRVLKSSGGRMNETQGPNAVVSRG